MKPKRQALPVALAAVLLPVGCAVLTIDVDVYKGPLINHEVVQVEQVAVMAIAAKPLLHQLRLRLEEEFLNKANLLPLPPVIFEGRFVRPGEYVFKDPQAGHVNNILSLYEDRGDPESSEVLEKIQDALRDYERSWATFRHPREAQESWDDLEAGFFPGLKSQAAEGSHVPLLQALGLQDTGDAAGVVRSVREMAQAYKGFLIPNQNNYRDEIPIFEAHGRLLTKYPAITARLARFKLPGILEVVEAPANLKFRQLEDESFVSAHAEILFQPPIDPKKTRTQETRKQSFVAEVTAVARAFRECRLAAARLWTGAIEYIILTNAPRNASHPMRGIRSAAAADLCLSLLKMEYLIGVMRLSKRQDAAYPESVERLKESLARPSAPYLSPSKAPVSASEREDVRGALRAELLRKPGETAQALLDADAFFRTGAALLDWKVFRDTGLRPRLRSEVGREHGLTPGPVTRPETIQPESLRVILQEIDRAAAAGLERGRLNPGLATLTENYLGVGQHRPRDERAREDLLEALVGFAQKVLFIANFDVLIGPKTILLVPWGTSVSVSPRSESAKPFVPILQAVGNSILIQVDELRYRKQYKDERPRAAKIEARGLAAAFPADPVKLIDDLTAALERQREVLKASIEAASQKPGEDGEASLSKADLEEEEENVLQALGILRERRLALAEGAVDGKEAPTRAAAFQGLLLDIQRDLTNARATLGAWEGRLRRLGAARGLLDVEEVKEVAKDAEPLEPCAFLDRLREVAVGLWQEEVSEKGPQTPRAHELALGRDGLEELRPTLDGPPKEAPAKLLDVLRKLLEREVASLKTALKEGGLAVRRLKAAAELLPPLRGLANFPQGEAQDPKEILDEIVAALRHEHIQAVKAQGKEAPQVKNIEAAIELAYTYRSGFVYIRPPSAYLRNSFPVTSLQPEARLHWENMLRRHFLRQLPFYEFLGKESDAKDAKAILDIDKQFWQNINRVRVAGGGRTNYVVAKDDIGNWYVKNYSADPQDIVKSAKNLALFSLSTGMGTNLLDRAGKAAPGEEAKTPEESAEKSTRAQQLETFAEKYRAATDTDDKSLRENGVAIEGRIAAAWEEDDDSKVHLDRLSKALTEASAEHLAVVKEEPPKGATAEALSEKVIAGLRSVKRFAAALQSRIRQLELPRAAADEATRTQNAAEPAQVAFDQAENDANDARDQAELAREAHEEAQREFDAARDAEDKAKKLAAAEPMNADLRRMALEAETARESAERRTKEALAKLSDLEMELEKQEISREEKRNALEAAEDAARKAKEDWEAAVRAERIALERANGVVRAALHELLKQRQGTVKGFHTALTIIAERPRS